MARTLDTKEYLDTVCALLEQGNTCVPVPVTGTSMTPFLDPGDTVYLQLPDRPPEIGDIVLFTRPDGQYVLHRIVAREPDGSFQLLGDRQTLREHVPAGQILARVCRATHRGRPLTPASFRWKFFAVLWRKLEGIRPRLLGLWYRATALKRFFQRKSPPPSDGK